MSNDEDLDTDIYRQRLIEARDELVELGSASEASRQTVALDQQSVGRLSRMDALQVQAMALATEERRQTQKRRIAAALKRIDEGVFGCCVACGDLIATPRLANDPTAPNCVGCAQAAGG
jgi:DnaK suppressor protein